jgi:hypothetical protein
MTPSIYFTKCTDGTSYYRNIIDWLHVPLPNATSIESWRTDNKVAMERSIAFGMVMDLSESSSSIDYVKSVRNPLNMVYSFNFTVNLDV